MQIIEKLALEHRVENVVGNITRAPQLSADLQDLCQNIYLHLLEYPANLIVDLWEHSAPRGGVTQMDCFIVRVVKNQLSPTGPYGWQRRQAARLVPIQDYLDTEDEQE